MLKNFAVILIIFVLMVGTCFVHLIVEISVDDLLSFTYLFLLHTNPKWRKIQISIKKKSYLTTGGIGGKGPLLSNDPDLRNISDPLLK